MRHAFAALVLVSALSSLDAPPAHAQSPYSYPWCAYYSPYGGGLSSCYFTTYAQCMASVSGVGGYCAPNPVYRGPDPGTAPKRKHRRHS